MGAFVGEEDVVEVGEDRLEPFAGAVPALVDDLLAGFRLSGGAGADPGAEWGAETDRDAGAAGLDLDVAEGGATVLEAFEAEAAGSFGDDVEDELVSAAGADRVPYDVMDLTHGANATSDVYAAIDNMVMQVGNVLFVQSLRMSRRAFETWVDEELPIDVFTARRIRAIHLAHQELSAEMLEGMPEPWEALFVRPQ